MTSVIERLGLWSPPYTIIYHSAEGVDEVICAKDGYEVSVPRQDWNQWRSGSGALIQNLMPYLSAEQREFLISGTTPDEWAKDFPPEGLK